MNIYSVTSLHLSREVTNLLMTSKSIQEILKISDQLGPNYVFDMEFEHKGQKFSDILQKVRRENLLFNLTEKQKAEADKLEKKAETLLQKQKANPQEQAKTPPQIHSKAKKIVEERQATSSLAETKSQSDLKESTDKNLFVDIEKKSRAGVIITDQEFCVLQHHMKKPLDPVLSKYPNGAHPMETSDYRPTSTYAVVSKFHPYMDPVMDKSFSYVNHLVGQSLNATKIMLPFVSNDDLGKQYSWICPVGMEIGVKYWFFITKPDSHMVFQIDRYNCQWSIFVSRKGKFSENKDQIVEILKHDKCLSSREETFMQMSICEYLITAKRCETKVRAEMAAAAKK